MIARRLRVGTRGSRLSLRQTQLVVDALTQVHPAVTVETVIVKTAGDRAPDVPLERFDGVGFFAKELEAALAEGRCDLAVHSAKDLPTELHPALVLGAVLRRTEPRDVLISRSGAGLADLPAGARIATSSPRRTAQILAYRPDLVLVPIRGNVDTRLTKMARGECDAICLAGAGLVRLGWQDRITEWLPPEVMLPAPAQGALAVETRRDDGALRGLLAVLDDADTHEAITAERAFLARLETGCRAPAGALARVRDGRIALEGLIAREDGSAVRRHIASGPVGAAQWLGTAVADQLLAGAAGVLNARADGESAVLSGPGRVP
ncbi:MAG TPA: hydroxymethylbilane synthase [bacterium]|nr:hydroxymethylbilane synthase [bacterium]